MHICQMCSAFGQMCRLTKCALHIPLRVLPITIGRKRGKLMHKFTLSSRNWRLGSCRSAAILLRRKYSVAATGMTLTDPWGGEFSLKQRTTRTAVAVSFGPGCQDAIHYVKCIRSFFITKSQYLIDGPAECVGKRHQQRAAFHRRRQADPRHHCRRKCSSLFSYKKHN